MLVRGRLIDFAEKCFVLDIVKGWKLYRDLDKGNTVLKLGVSLMINRVIQQFGLHVRSINEVEDSYSSTVYKCHLVNGQHVYLKIPYTKLKYQRELEAYKILKGHVAIPAMLDYWSGDEECSGAFLLSELKGEPLSSDVSPSVAFQVGVLHASMHTIQPPVELALTGIQNEFQNWSNFIEKQFYMLKM
jgi:hypothetical protein